MVFKFLKELKRGDRGWGTQSHPSGTGILKKEGRKEKYTYFDILRPWEEGIRGYLGKT